MSSELLFSRLIPVRFVSEDCALSTLPLLVSISSVPSVGSKNGPLLLSLTDPADPALYYHLAIAEQDYMELKRKQALHVEFGAFVANLTGLLEQCMQQKLTAAEFLVAKNTKSAKFKIFQFNEFKNLDHLELEFKEGNDSEVKQYLAVKMLEMKNAKQIIEDALGRAQEQVQVLRSEQCRLTELIEKAKLAHQQEILDLKYANF